MTSAGYWPSTWPVECGGNHRPKTAFNGGLALSPTDRLVATTRHTGDWPVMFVQRDRGELFLAGTSLDAGPRSSGWVERVDPVTLAALDRSDALATGGHEWCGSIAIHRNGDLYTVNGSVVHRLGPDCRVVAERQLPIDHAHNGLLILDDGSIITKDIRSGPVTSTLTLLDPDLSVLATIELPEASMGRLSAHADGAGGDTVYVPGTTRIFRYRWDGHSLTTDPTWDPSYRSAGAGGLAWDTTIVNRRVWFHDNGNVPASERRFEPETGGVAELGDDPGWSEPVRLVGIGTDRPDDKVEILPTELAAGWVMTSPLVTEDIAVAWDTGNTGLAAFQLTATEPPEMLWFQPFRCSMHPLLYPETGELVINDYRYLDDGTMSDDLVVVDVTTGRMKARVATGANRYNGMFLTPGWDRDLYYCNFETVARVEARSM